jgi:hypothetical protein
MDTKLSNRLFKKYKFLKKSEMLGGFQCEDGWFPVLEDMFKSIQDSNPPDNFLVTLVEERYGTLKVHSRGGNNRTRVIIEDAQEVANDICDRCGGQKDDEGCDKCKQPVVNYDDE